MSPDEKFGALIRPAISVGVPLAVVMFMIAPTVRAWLHDKRPRP